MSRTILCIGAMDTKGEEYAYVSELIEKRGHKILVMDTGIWSESIAPDSIPSAQVAEAGGSSLEHLRKQADRGTAMEIMRAGVRQLVPALYSQGRFQGILGLGGGAGTSIATAAMRTLPVGVPKLMVSTLASSNVHAFVALKDITMMHSVVDIAGLNRISKPILANAAGAICGMVESELAAVSDRPAIAATMFGVTTPCVELIRKHMEAAGFECIVFHATGTGGRTMETLIEDGFFTAVADITTTEWCDEVVGGVLPGGPDRFGAAGRNAIPQVVSCGALDMVNFHALNTVPEHFRQRTLYRHNADVTLMRTRPDECQAIASRMAESLNRARGPVTFLMPLQGVSMLDKKGEPFYDPDANRVLFETFRQELSPSIRIVEADMHINDPGFAQLVSQQLLSALTPNGAT